MSVSSIQFSINSPLCSGQSLDQNVKSKGREIHARGNQVQKTGLCEKRTQIESDHYGYYRMGQINTVSF